MKSSSTIFSNSITVSSIVLIVVAAFVLGFVPLLLPVRIGGLLILLTVVVFVSLQRESTPFDLTSSDQTGDIEDDDFRLELGMLEEAAAFFSASLSEEEMRILLASRIASLLDGCSVGVAVPVEDGFKFDDSNIPDIALTRDLVEVTALGNDVVTVEDLQRKNDSFDLTLAAVPLKRGKKLFGVLVIAPSPGRALPTNKKIASIADVAGPLLAGAQNFEASASNALRDGLTELPNERAMKVVLDQQIAESERFGFERKLSLLVIDIANFDDFNSNYGHVEGDRLLAHAANVLSSCVRKMDYVSRISSDEFVIVMPKVDSKSVSMVLERITNILSEKNFVTRSGDGHKIEVNFGVAVYGEDAFDGETLIKNALQKKEVSRNVEKGDLLIFPTADKRSDIPIS